jgi:nitroimidazol reductase NimA-like FMN-containing flavoprotein (pyridoxamine 5'-phosphate oxidase superfamily)
MLESSSEMEMRRSDREITARSEIDEIIHGCQICHLACAVDGDPYVVPVSFGYDGSAVYFHTSRDGKKIDFISANPRVCLEFERKVNLVTNDSDACKWSFTFESAIGYGFAKELLDAEERAYGLNQIMLHYSGREWQFNSSVLANTRVWRVPIESVTGKRSEQKAT